MTRSAAAILMLSISAAIAGEPRFEGPLTIPKVLRPVMVDAGDFNKDGKPDLVTVNGSDLTLVLLQNPSDRSDWKPLPLSVGNGGYFARAGDFDGDQYDDLVVADPATTAYLVRNSRDGNFASPKALPKTKASRWIAIGDWNKDGSLDLASANHDLSTISILTGDGTGNFAVTQNPMGDDTHAIEALDYDADGKLDLALGVGTAGVALLHGLGDGNFGQPTSLGIRCVRYLATGNFNKDGKGDLAASCDMEREMTILVSQANGAYRATLKAPLSVGNETPAIGDLNGDGNEDVAVISAGSQNLAVFLGKGDGAFLPTPELFGQPGQAPSFFIARDLDGDGHNDVVSADTGSSTLTVFWGQAGDRFLEAADVITGFGPVKGFAMEDFDRNGDPDFFLPSNGKREVNVYLNPGEGPQKRTSLKIHPAFSYRVPVALDLDGDGIPDLAGTSLSTSIAVSLLGADGSTHDETTLQAGLVPSAIQAGKVGDGDTWDLVVPCTGSSYVAVFLGQSGGKFDEARTVPTVELPLNAILGDLDGDTKTDLVVLSPKVIALHYGAGDGSFSEATVLSQSPVNTFKDAAAADIDGDGTLDVVTLSQAGVGIHKGKGARQFESPVSPEMGIENAAWLLLFDVDGDGRLDITLSSSDSHSVSILLNQGSLTFAQPRIQSVGAVELGHRFADLNSDAAVDLVAFSSTSAVIYFGFPPPPPPPGRFRRGDANGDGKVAITDAIFVLNWLFRGGPPAPCEDAADANDDGVVNLTDPIRTLRRLFQGDAPLPPPGSESCDEDPTADELPECTGICQAE